MDFYSLYARVFPMWVLLFPGMLALLAWVPTPPTIPTFLVGLGVTTAMSYYLSQIGRDAGYRLQNALWQSWGGPPSTQLLRFTGPLNPLLREHYHTKLSSFIGKPFPKREDEYAAPARADEIYELAVVRLIGATRDKKRFPLIFKELTSYGFRRNLFGLRWSGVAIASCSAVACVIASEAKGKPEYFVFDLLCVIILAFWLVRVNSDWIRVPAFAYAKVLLEACDVIDIAPLSKVNAEARGCREGSDEEPGERDQKGTGWQDAHGRGTGAD